jgi:hypothetical protein
MPNANILEHGMPNANILEHGMPNAIIVKHQRTIISASINSAQLFQKKAE